MRDSESADPPSCEHSLVINGLTVTGAILNIIPTPNPGSQPQAQLPKKLGGSAPRLKIETTLPEFLRYPDRSVLFRDAA